MISLDKPLQTREGREVQIYTQDAPGPFPIHGCFYKSNGDAVMVVWTKDGKASSSSLRDLVNKRPYETKRCPTCGQNIEERKT